MSGHQNQSFDKNETKDNSIQVFGSRNVNIGVRQVSDREILNSLPYAAGAGFDSDRLERESSCLQGTRTGLLDLIDEWIQARDGQTIFWLSGMAGTGKSTIARTVARNCSKKDILGASFFFSRGGGDLENGSLLFTTFARQLAIWGRNNRNDALADAVLKAIEDNPDVAGRAKSEQWKHLILRPLASYQKDQTPSPILMIVVDALDECDRDADLIVQALANTGGLKTVQLKILLTSRPGFTIDCGFTRIAGMYRDLALHEIERHIVQKDLHVFFIEKFNLIRKDYGLGGGFPGDDVIKLLVQRAGKLFIYAATICLFVGDRRHPPPKKRLEIVLNSGRAGGSAVERHLDSIYTQILQQAMLEAGDDSDFNEQLRQIIGIIVVLLKPLSMTGLAGLLNDDVDDTKHLLENLKSVLNIPQDGARAITLLHPSFRDFLLNKERCSELSLSIDEVDVHRKLATSCLQLMNNHLKADICGLIEINTLIKDIDHERIQRGISTELQYACTYWVEHLERAIRTTNEIEDGLLAQISEFLKNHILHWFEAQSLLGKMANAIPMLTTLQKLVKDTELSDIVQDAYRFSLSNRAPIEQAPLQVYCSAVLFSPSRSMLREISEQSEPLLNSNGIDLEDLSWISTKPKVPERWGMLLQVLAGHTRSVESVCFSPDGKSIVSGSGDHTVRIWDAVTGALQQTLDGHSSRVTSVAFSPRGTKIVSGHWDKTVCIWDAASGNLEHTLRGHSHWVNTVAFSPSGDMIISGSRDATVRIWDAVSGQLDRVLEGHEYEINSVAFSPCGERIASGSKDYSVRVWSVSGRLLHTLEGHTHWVRSVTFSPESGTKIASGSEDSTVRIWNAETGGLLHILEKHTRTVMHVVFSKSNEDVIIFASESGNIQTWNAAAGTLLQNLELSGSDPTDFALSPFDGCRMVSGHEDGNLRVWDLNSTDSSQPNEANPPIAFSVAFSLCGTKIVSGNDDSTVTVWDFATETLLQTLEGHEEQVTSAAFSPCGNLIVSGSWDETVRIWNIETGEMQTLEGHEDGVISVAFSPKGDKVLSGSHDKTIRLWDATTSTLLKTFQGHRDWVRSVTFAPDDGGETIASASDDRTVRIWNTSNGAMLKKLEGHGDGILSVTFSPKGDRLVSGSRFDRTNIWDVKTGILLHRMHGVHYNVRPIANSLDGKRPCLGFNGEWITLNGKRMLWLPEDRRLEDPDYQCIAVHGNKLAIASRSGPVFFEFDLERALSLIGGHDEWLEDMEVGEASDDDDEGEESEEEVEGEESGAETEDEKKEYRRENKGPENGTWIMKEETKSKEPEKGIEMGRTAAVSEDAVEISQAGQGVSISQDKARDGKKGGSSKWRSLLRSVKDKF